ncbi:MAG TPA: hypothetical protein VMD30_04905, partial [Tepidisphaeraceae bacterium]|nr:hypothetical protein [Tepidisphaeraceae bacterium]
MALQQIRLSGDGYNNPTCELLPRRAAKPYFSQVLSRLELHQSLAPPFFWYGRRFQKGDRERMWCKPTMPCAGGKNFRPLVKNSVSRHSSTAKTK